MTDKELLYAASEFTKGILDGVNSSGMQYMVCLPLQGYLSFGGIEVGIAEGYVKMLNKDMHRHLWLKLPDGRILDPTADQFSEVDRIMPSTYLGQLPKWYYPFAGK